MNQPLLWLTPLLFAGAGCGAQTPRADEARDERPPKSDSKSALPVDRAPGCKLDAVPYAKSCPPATCGSNSPVVNGFPFNGLREDCRNAENLWIVPGSVVVKQVPACSGSPLTVLTNGRLKVGTCEHGELEGASFLVRNKETGADVRIRIANAEEASSGTPSDSYHAYKFTVLGSTASLCSREAAALVREHLDLNSRKDPEVDDEDSAADATIRFADTKGNTVGNSQLALVEEGELFDEDIRLLADPTAPGQENQPWLSFQCVRDSLAKTGLERIAGLRPMPNTAQYLRRRRAALRMMTATHCGIEHYTVKGTRVRWHPDAADQSTTHTFPTSYTGRDIEAVWDADKVRCISQARVALRDFPSGIPNRLKVGFCENNACTPEQHAQAMRTKCSVPDCSSAAARTGEVASYGR